MSDLGTIFHVKKSGIQYDAHAYTTLGECPEPNLKLMFKGQQAYVKLAAKGSGDVPCYVRTKAGGLYQVKKEAVASVTYVDVTITQSANQTIHVYTPQKNGGTDHTSSFMIPKGTTYEAEVIAHSGYTAGTLNANRTGTFTSNTQFTATAAHENTQSDAAQMVVGRLVRAYAANYEYRWYGSSRSGSSLGEVFGSLTPNPINGVTIYLICRSETVIQGERRDVDFSINTDKPCKVTIANDTYTVDKQVSNGYEYKTTDLSNINLSDGQQFTIKVDLL